MREVSHPHRYRAGRWVCAWVSRHPAAHRYQSVHRHRAVCRTHAGRIPRRAGRGERGEKVAAAPWVICRRIAHSRCDRTHFSVWFRGGALARKSECRALYSLSRAGLCRSDHAGCPRAERHGAADGVRVLYADHAVGAPELLAGKSRRIRRLCLPRRGVPLRACDILKIAHEAV